MLDERCIVIPQYGDVARAAKAMRAESRNRAHCHGVVVREDRGREIRAETQQELRKTRPVVRVGVRRLVSKTLDIEARLGCPSREADRTVDERLNIRWAGDLGHDAVTEV